MAYIRAVMITGEHESIASAWWPAGLAIAILPTWFRGRFIVIAHGMEIKPSTGGLRRLLMRYAFERSHRIIANSSFTRQLVKDAGIHNRLTTIPCGVDKHPIQASRASEPTVLSVGRLIERKGFDRVLRAIAALAPLLPDIRYEVVGHGPQRVELERLVETLDIADRVKFLGSLSNEEMDAAYGRAWCFALPARRINDDVEGFGIVYLEAAMYELATIGGRDSGAVDAIQADHTGLLVNGDDVAEIAQAINALLSNPQLANAMGQRGRERALRDFQWANLTAKMLDVLKS